MFTRFREPATSKEELLIERIDFDYLKGKARMVLQDGTKERDVRVNVRIRKDSVIWMTFSVVGVHGGQALINHDSITIVNNVDKEFYVFDYKELSKQFNFEINYPIIQAAALGNLIMERKENDIITKQDDNNFLLHQNSGTVDVINLIDAVTRKVVKTALKERNTNNTLTIDYSNFQLVGEKLFPYDGTISVFYKTPAGLVNTTISIQYSKAEVGDKELNFPFNIPKRYVRR